MILPSDFDQALHREKLQRERAERAEAERDELRVKLEQARAALHTIINEIVTFPGEFDADSEIVAIAREAQRLLNSVSAKSP